MGFTILYLKRLWVVVFLRYIKIFQKIVGCGVFEVNKRKLVREMCRGYISLDFCLLLFYVLETSKVIRMGTDL